MRTIQEVGLEIFNNSPAHLYFFVGSEIGIKEKYIELIRAYYGDSVSANSLTDIFKMMNTRHLVPLKPKLYVVRYDEEFISSLNDKTAKDISNLNIIGTIVAIYENGKVSAKLDKYLGNYTVPVERVADNFVESYLQQDFPELTKRYIEIAVKHSSNYGQAKNICRSLSSCDRKYLSKMTDEQIADLVGYTRLSTETQIKYGLASRNIPYLMNVIDKFDGEADSIIYTMLSTLIELEKINGRKYTESDLKEYSKCWDLEDIYNMFMQCYSCLKTLRSASVAEPKNLLYYIASLLAYRPIPNVEVFAC